jgi:hypothetical protein
MAKFKVGDKITWSSHDKEYAVIKEITREGSYVYDIRSKHTHEIRTSNYSYRISQLEDVCSLWEHKVADTEIARKLYTGRIEKEKDGYLWIKA